MIDRTLELLRLLAERPDTGLRVPEIVDRLGLHRVTVHRLLKSLVDLGYVEQGEDRRYYLGLEAWYLGAAAAARFRLPARALEAMDRVAAETQDVVFLMRRTRLEAVCVCRREGTYPVRSLVMDVGARRPLGVGATSLAVLAALPDAEVEAITAMNAAAYAGFAGMSVQVVSRCVAETRDRGYALSTGSVIPEVYSIGTPIRAGREGQVVAGLSVATVESRLRPDRQATIADLLRREARIIGDSLAGHAPDQAAAKQAPARMTPRRRVRV